MTSRAVAPLASFVFLALAGCSSGDIGDGGALGTSHDASAIDASNRDATSSPLVDGSSVFSADSSSSADSGSPVDASAIDAPAEASRPTKTIYVTGGQDDRRIISFDGTTWSHDVYTAPSGKDNAMNGVAVGAGVIVGVADVGIFMSTDGITWTMQAAPDGEDFHTSALVYGGGRFVFVTGDISYASTDGITWQKDPMTNATAGHWQSIAYGVIDGVGHYMAVGDSCHKTSEDGLSWHDYVTGIESLQDIAFANGKFVAIGAHSDATATVGRSVISTDAKTFSADSLTTTTCYSTGFGGLVNDGTKWITSDGCNAWTSTDGATWTKQGKGINRGRIVYAGGKCVAMTYYATLFESDDCTNFAQTADFSKTPNVFVDGGVASSLSGLGAGDIFQ